MAFRTQIKVCFADIDNAGIVYYPRFLHYFHLAMEEFFGSELGMDYADVLHKRNLSFPTVHVECDFRRRLRYGRSSGTSSEVTFLIVHRLVMDAHVLNEHRLQMSDGMPPEKGDGKEKRRYGSLIWYC